MTFSDEKLDIWHREAVILIAAEGVPRK